MPMRSKLSRNNIAYDLTISPHILKVVYGEEILTYVFSSKLYRQKFIDRMINYREHINKVFYNRYKFTINHNIVADINLYSTIEKRGFLIINNRGENIQCLDNLILDGLRVM